MPKDYFDNYYEATATSKKKKGNLKKIQKMAVKRYCLLPSFYTFEVTFLKFAK